MIKIHLNGGIHELETSVSITALLASLGFEGKPVVVELDQEAVFPRDYPTVMITEGARVEVVALAAGG
jgi:thiamine biosynthesis protein ThiS